MRTTELVPPAERNASGDEGTSTGSGMLSGKAAGDRFATLMENGRPDGNERSERSQFPARPGRAGQQGEARIRTAGKTEARAAQSGTSTASARNSGARPSNGVPERNASNDEDDRTTEPDAQVNGALDISSAVPLNIIPLPFVPVIVPFPAASGGQLPGAASSSEASIAAGLGTAAALDQPAGDSPSSVEAGPQAKGIERFSGESGRVLAAAGFNVIEAAFDADSRRERLAAGLRQAMAELEELQDQTPVPLGRLIPFPGSMPADSKIVTVDFGAVNISPEDDLAAPSETRPNMTQLPSNVVGEENPAAEPPAILPLEEVALGRSNRPKPVLGGAFVIRDDQPRVVPASAGITAARQEIRMESRASNEQQSFSGQEPDAAAEAMPAAGPKPTEVSLTQRAPGEWQAEALSEVSGQPASDPSIRNPDLAATVDRMAKLIVREVALIRQHGSDSMAVVLRPDENTELFLHVSHRNGQIEATVRCERGDFGHLNALWSQLQESLSQQKIRLTPLQGAASDTQYFRSPGGSQQSMGGGDSSPREQPPGREFLDEWPAPASPANNPVHVRSRRGSRHRLTTSRPGWETWA